MAVFITVPRSTVTFYLGMGGGGGLVAFTGFRGRFGREMGRAV
jgi:hypothetical protein